MLKLLEALNANTVLNVVCTARRDVSGKQRSARPSAGAVAAEEVCCGRCVQPGPAVSSRQNAGDISRRDCKGARQRAAKTQASGDRSGSGDIKAGRLCPNPVLNVIRTAGWNISGQKHAACPTACAVAAEEVCCCRCVQSGSAVSLPLECR